MPKTIVDIGNELLLTNDELSQLKHVVQLFPHDPYEVAYMRGGDREILTLHLFDLMQRGFLTFIEHREWFGTSSRLTLTREMPSIGELTETDRELLAWFKEPQTARDVFNHGFPEKLKADCFNYRRNLLKSGVLTGWVAPENSFVKYWPAVTSVGFILVIVASGLLGWSTQVPVYYFAFAAFLAAIQYLIGIRLTAAGKRYLKQLQAQSNLLKELTKTARLGVSNPIPLIGVAIFGTRILQESEYDAFHLTLGQGSGSYGIENGGGCDGAGCGG